MRTTGKGETPLSLIIQRLMDADLLLPEEGRALLSEIEAFDLTRDEAHEKRASEHSEPFLPSLEALLQTGRLDTSIAGKAQAIVHQILHGESDPD
jgi:hypothetical protein